MVGGYALQCRYGQHGETSDAFEYPEIKPSAHGDNLIAWNTFNRAAEMKSDAGGHRDTWTAGSAEMDALTALQAQ